MKIAYNVDGSIATRTDQRGTVLTFTYNSRRQLELQGATTLGAPGHSTDGHVKSIKREYDALARLETITSYANDDGTPGAGTVRNQVKMHFNDLSQVTHSYQSHEGVVDDDGSGTDTPNVQYGYDLSTSGGGIYDDHGRLIAALSFISHHGAS